jgi:hypothetical protein
MLTTNSSPMFVFNNFDVISLSRDKRYFRHVILFLKETDVNILQKDKSLF